MQPWRNGAGVTREIVADAPGDAFGWRISIASIDRNAPFSTFAGYDRTLVQLAGGVLLLTLPDDRITLHPGEHVAFAGEDVVSARVDEPATVLNVMTDRTRFTHRIDRWTVCGDRRVGASGTAVVIALTAGLHAGDVALEPLDAVMVAAVPIMMTGTGTALAITFVADD